MRFVLHKEIPEDADLRRQWNELVLREPQPQVFYTYEWALAVCRAYHATLLPLLFLAYDEEEALCGVAALASDPERRRASFLCATTGDYCDFLSPLEKRENFVRGVLAELRKANIHDMAFANLPADSSTVAALGRDGSRQPDHCFARTGYICAQVSLAALERRGDDKPVLPRKKMLRRFLNAMGRENPVRLDHARTWSAAEPVLPQLMQAHVARFLATGRISNMARPERKVFLTELARLLSDSGWLVLTRMMSGEKVFAWNYGFQFHGTWFWYQPTFDSDLEKYSPGFCLLAKVIEDAADDEGFKLVDLGLGAEEYKDRFANGSRETLFVRLKSSVFAHWREIIRYRVATALTSSHRVEAGVRSVLSKLKRAKSRFAESGLFGTLAWTMHRLRSLIWNETEVYFYEWHGPIFSGRDDVRLLPLDLLQLAAGASEYVDEEETLTYLLRSAERLRSGKAEGYVLVDSAGKPLHFAWSTRFDGFFLSELNAKVESASHDALMFFDCWTPHALRGRGYYAQTIELAAEAVQKAGKRPWIFSASENSPSVRGLAKSGFQRRYSLFRKKLFWWQRVTGQPAVSAKLPTAEASARV